MRSAALARAVAMDRNVTIAGVVGVPKGRGRREGSVGLSYPGHAVSIVRVVLFRVVRIQQQRVLRIVEELATRIKPTKKKGKRE